MAGLDTNVILLLHMDTNAGNFVDSSSSAHTAVPTNVTQVATPSKFGNDAAYFAGTSNQLDIASHPDFGLGTGDWTLDFWVNRSSLANSAVFAIGGYSTGMSLRWQEGSPITVYFNTNTYYYSMSWSTGTWYHIAVQRSGTTLTVFLDGVSLADHTIPAGLTIPQSAIRIGEVLEGGAGSFNGYMDELRLSNVARYSGNFTPPTEAYAEEQAGGGAPLLCWQLAGQYKKAPNRVYQITGPNKFPGLDKLELPELLNISVIEDGKKII